MEEQKYYITSLFGRFGYFVMCFPAALLSLMFVAVIKEIIGGTYKGSTGYSIFISVLGIFCSCMLVQCMYRLFKSSPRFIITSDNLTYIGIFNKQTFNWSDIKEISLCFAGGPFVYLFIFTKKRRKPYRLEVSGLNPNYNELVSDINSRILQTEPSDSKWISWSRNNSA